MIYANGYSREQPSDDLEHQMNAEARLSELGITLPGYPKTVGNYVQAVLVGDMLHIAGHGPARVDAGDHRAREGGHFSPGPHTRASRVNTFGASQLADTVSARWHGSYPWSFKESLTSFQISWCVQLLAQKSV